MGVAGKIRQKLLPIIREITAQELSYPSGSPYRCETGGRLVALRDLCSNARVRDFHRRYYRLCNCNIIIAGPVDHERLLKTVEQYECQLLADAEYGLIS